MASRPQGVGPTPFEPKPTLVGEKVTLRPIRAEDADVLAGVSFAIEPGEKVAFVGESGGGKTTLINLLLGLYEVRSGTIRVMGHDVRDLSTSQLRAAIGVVFQEPNLFSGTIAENIGYADPDAPRAVIEAAAVEVGELGELADELELHGFERAIAVLGNDDLAGALGGVAHLVLRDFVILGAVEEDYHVGILLNGMTIMDLSFTLQNLVKGTVLLIAIIVDSLVNPRDEQTAQQGDI